MLELTEKAREAQRQYLREWRKRNQDKVRLYNRRYWEKKAVGRPKTTETDRKEAPK